MFIMLRFFWKFVLFATVVVYLCGRSGFALAEDLWQTYQAALDHDPRLKAALHRKQGAFEVLPQSEAALYPAASVSSQHGFYKQSTLDKDSYDTSGFSLSVMVPIYHRDRLLGLDMAKTGMDMAELGYVLEQQQHVLRVAEKYFNVLSAEESLNVALAEETAMMRQLDLAKEGLSAGTAIITEVQEAQSGADFAKAQVVASRNAVLQRQRELTELTGFRDQALNLSPLKQDIPIKEPDPALPDRWVENGLANNVNLKIMSSKQVQAQQGVEKARAEHLPTVDATTGYSYSDSGGSNYWTGGVPTSKTNYLTVQLNVPLYAGGATVSKVRQAEQALQEARFELDRSRQEVETGIRNAYLDVQTAIAQVTAFNQALTSSSSVLQTTRESHAAGLRTMLDVLNAERDVFRAMRNLADARYRYILGALRLKFNSGQLVSQDLSNINEWLKK
ncbi:MAG: TolC family outer membrane protein [Magnetococcales bacterium]|nr:TolC family outer membrane protein [Magnetococcales bacterium]MBF0150158.1 TolC family outer membrane protein [Magnetococcales bacterium]